MKLTHSVELDSSLEEVIDSALTGIEEAITYARRFHPLGVHADVAIDLNDVLSENRLIAHVWGIEDVREVRPHLTEEEAWEVLQAVERRLNSEFGINWDFVRDVADELYPEPTNANRENWAKQALAIFTAETFGGDHPDTMPVEDLQNALTDLLSDLLHLAHTHELDVDDLVERAGDHFRHELAEEGRS